MKCPFTKSIITVKTSGTIDNDPFVDTIQTKVKFGECEKCDCPYFDVAIDKCRRCNK